MRGRSAPEEARGEVEGAFRSIDLRASREAAWRAFSRGEISPDPSFGGGADEIDFPGGANRVVRGALPFPSAPGILRR